MAKFKLFQSKIDKDYYAWVGLTKRVTLPEELDFDHAKHLKYKTQERVMELWNQHQGVLSKFLDMEELLQILECLAEDELYLDHNLEIEQIEKYLYKKESEEAKSIIQPRQV